MDNNLKPGNSSKPLGELFDPKSEIMIHDRLRPHWSQAGAIVFVTFRTHDSIPQRVMQNWDRKKNIWLAERGLLTKRHWSDVVPDLGAEIRRKFNKHFNRCREDFLDSCHGKCLLRNPELAQIVTDALLHFDGERYSMGDFVVMPNHVHLLAAFPGQVEMAKQFYSWLHYTAFKVNKAVGSKGHFWQQEPFDHLVRSVHQYEYLRKYIEENPAKANLVAGEFIYRRYER